MIDLAALSGAVVAGRIAARHGHPVELVMTVVLTVVWLAATIIERTP